MKLVSVERAAKTANDKILLLTVLVDYGNGQRESVPVTYDPDNLTNLTIEAAGWMMANPGLFIHPYKPPAPPAASE